MKFAMNTLFLIVFFLVSSGCAYISEIGLLHKADVDDSVFEVPLEIDVQKNIISNHMMIKPDGSLWSMDVNFRDSKFYLSKELYLGRKADGFFGKVEFISDVKEVAANGGVVIALKNDGTLWSWGKLVSGPGYLKNIGFLGYDKAEMNKPRKILGLPPIQSVVMSSVGVAAIDGKGNVWRWGERRFQIRPGEKDLNSEFNSVAYDLPIPDYLDVQFNQPIKIKSLKSIAKVSKRYDIYLTGSGDILKSISPRFVERMREYIDAKVGVHLYKMKMPSKAVDVVMNTVLLANGQVYELANIEGAPYSANYGKTINPTRRLKGLSRVTRVADKAALTESGEVYRWGQVYYFGQPVELMQRYYPKEPVYVGVIPEAVVYFSRDLITTENGSVYLYGNQNTFIGFDNKYRPEEALPFYDKNFYVSPLARRSSIKNATTYFKLIKITWR